MLAVPICCHACNKWQIQRVQLSQNNHIRFTWHFGMMPSQVNPVNDAWVHLRFLKMLQSGSHFVSYIAIGSCAVIDWKLIATAKQAIAQADILLLWNLYRYYLVVDQQVVVGCAMLTSIFVKQVVPYQNSRGKLVVLVQCAVCTHVLLILSIPAWSYSANLALFTLLLTFKCTSYGWDNET